MVHPITAFQTPDGKLFASKSEAEDYALRNAVEVVCRAEHNHLMNVAFGHSTCAETRDALRLIVSRLSPEPARPTNDR